MKTRTMGHALFFVAFILIFSSCHPRNASDIRPNMTKEEVVALWGGTSLITYKTVDGKTYETWEYHFATTDSNCWVTFFQDRVVSTNCRKQPSPYYVYPYPYYYPYRYYYPYPYYYPYRPY